MNKRFLTLGLAAALALSMSAPAFAADATAAPDADTGVYSSKTEITGTTQAPTIKVTVPSTGAVVINPYQMEVTLDTAKVKNQIVSATQYITSESNVAISISATATGTAAGDAVIGSAVPTATTTTKTAYIYMEMVPAADNTTAVTSWATKFDAKTMAVVGITGKATTVKGIGTLAATDTATPKTYTAFRLNGAVASNPTKPWAVADTIAVSIAFTFAPVMGTNAP